MIKIGFQKLAKVIYNQYFSISKICNVKWPNICLKHLAMGATALNCYFEPCVNAVLEGK